MDKAVIVTNNDKVVKAQLPDGSTVECWKAEHDYNLFPVGEAVIVSGAHIIKHATTGHTYLPIDWRSNRYKEKP